MNSEDMKIKLARTYDCGRQVNDEPIVYVFDNYIGDDEVFHLKKAGQSLLQAALVSSDSAGIVSSGRTGRNCWIAHQKDKVILRLAERISTLVKIPLDHAESFQLIHYGQSQQYAAHFDAWDGATERGARCMARGGQRLVTCLLYLNDVEEGGATGFPKLDLEVDAVKGRMVVFHNCEAGSSLRHPASLHGGLPVRKGEKWACNLWFRERSYK